MIIDSVGYHTTKVSGWDIVVCELDKNLGTTWGWNGVATPATTTSFYKNQLWSSVGYPGNLADGERAHRNSMSIFDVEKDDHHSLLLKKPGATPARAGPADLCSGGTWVPAIRRCTALRQVAMRTAGEDTLSIWSPSQGRGVW